MPDERYEVIKSIHEGGWAQYKGEWFVWPPGTYGAASISDHTVVEHEDGTITVSPSIAYSTPDRDDYWHGYLEHGVWRRV
jgi:hypothetical protein